MRRGIMAGVAAGVLLAGGGGAYALTGLVGHAGQARPHRTVAAASAPMVLDPTDRDLAAHKGHASAKGQARHAAATRARQAREAAVREARRVAAQADSKAGQRCVGDDHSWREWQPDGTCSGPTHRGGGGYYDADGNPCPGSSPCQDAPGYGDDNTNNDPLIRQCPAGTATSPECARLIRESGH